MELAFAAANGAPGATIDGAAPIPGGRIEGYRNSSSRQVRLLGLGEAGGKIARAVAKRGLSNVAVATSANPVGWDDLVPERVEARANLIIIVCTEGDEALFRPEQGKPDALVTFVLLRKNMCDVRGDELANVRRFADLFVTTTDPDYVSELIDNLAG
jgi:hypothetical protein